MWNETGMLLVYSDGDKVKLTLEELLGATQYTLYASYENLGGFFSEVFSESFTTADFFADRSISIQLQGSVTPDSNDLPKIEAAFSEAIYWPSLQMKTDSR